MGQIRVGLSGWLYPRWRGVFYPAGLAQKRELEFAASQFSSLEVNGTFYSLKRPDAFRAWHAATPDNFVFSIKGSRYITHMLRLRDIDAALANFFAQGVLALEDKLGPFLWQFPERMTFDAERFASFFDRLPRSFADAAKLARSHDARLNGRAFTSPKSRGALRHCIEVRHASFGDPSFARLLRKHAIGLVVSDSPAHWPVFESVTSDLVYVRLHGDKELYTSGYTPRSLARWNEKIVRWSAKADVFAYFDNDAKVYAPRDARRLHRLLEKSAPGRRLF